MKCYICEQENWNKMPDFHSDPKAILQVCKNCGNVCYEVDIKQEPILKEYYKKNYRGQITEGNILTTSRKLGYIRGFIGDWLRDREKIDPTTGKPTQQLTIGDVGCATGYIPAFFKGRGHKSTGSEWTTTMRRFAEHFYGILTTEELETKHKYDFISMYHTLEHFMEPNKKLEHYVSLLKDDGAMIVSTPEWLDILEDASGSGVRSVEHLFHKDHINVFTKQSIQNLFRKAGLEIIKDNYTVYGQTYLLKKGKKQEIIKGEWQKIVKILETQKKAIQAWQKGEWENAIEIYPKFPEAYIDLIYKTSIRKDTNRTEDILNKALKLMPNEGRLSSAKCMFLYQTEKWKEAKHEYDALIKDKPNEDIYMFRGWTHYHLGMFQEAKMDFISALQLNPQKWTEAMRWITKICGELPNWQEMAEQQLKEKLFKEAKPRFEPPEIEPNQQENVKKQSEQQEKTTK